MTVLAPLTLLSGIAEHTTITTVDNKIRGTAIAQTETLGDLRRISGGIAYVSVGGDVASVEWETLGSPYLIGRISGEAESVTVTREGKGVSASFLGVLGSASDKQVAGVNSVFSPLSTYLRSPLPIPSFASINNIMYPLVTSGRLLTGEIGQIESAFTPLEGKASKAPYAQISTSFMPLTSEVFEGYPQDEAWWYEMFYVTMPCRTNAEYVAEILESLKLSGSAVGTVTLLARVIESLRVSTSLTGGALQTASVEEALRLLSSVGRENVFAVFALNLTTNASSTYENYAFNSMAEWGDKYIAASDDGLYVLTGDSDDGAPIDASLTLGVEDYGSPRLKTVPYVYVGAVSDAEAYITAKVDGGEEYSYPLPASEVLGTKRAVLGRGLRSRYWQFTISNTDGAAIEIDSMNIEMAELNRRI